MKALSFILSCYLLVLLLVPCCAFDKCPDDAPVAGTTEEHRPGDTDDCGTCSPFFNCEGCAAYTVVAESFTMETPAEILRAGFSEHLSIELPVIQYDFWQPPRIG